MDISLLLMLGGGILLLIVLFRVFSAPIRLAVKLLIHAVIGFAALFAINFLGAAVGIAVEFTWLNALIAGLLGVPGVILLIVLQFI